MAKEIWKPIPGYEKEYEASDQGNIRSLDRKIICSGKIKGTYISFKKGRLLKPARNTKQGHVTVSLGKHNSINVHVLIAATFIGKRPVGHDVAHLNGDAKDNRLSNLQYKTRSDNNRDMVFHGKTKLSVEEIKHIKSFPKNLKNNRYLRKKYKLSYSELWHIQKGISYGQI